MIQPRWHKVLADLWKNKARTFLVVLSISVGVYAIGMVGGMYFIFINDLDTQYQAVNPHHATIYASSFDNLLLQSARKVPGVAQAEGRSAMGARAERSPDNWAPIILNAIPPLDQISIDQLTLVSGKSTPDVHEILLEQASVDDVHAKVGSVLRLQLPDKSFREMRVVGIVHDMTAFPAALSGQVTAYVSPGGMEYLGGSRDPNIVYLTVSERSWDETHVKEVAHEVALKIEKSGRQVYTTVVSRPGEHPIRSSVQTLLAVLAILGILIVLLSGFLVINTINGLLNQHLRQIGMMKAIGARTYQVTAMYFVLVILLGIISLIITVPLGAILGYMLSSGIARFFNFSLTGFRFAPASVAMQVFVAIVIPLCASVVPILHGTRITVREAITNYGMGRGQFGRTIIDRVVTKLSQVPIFSRPLLISLRNTIRRKLRLAMTLFTLVLAGAIFVSVYNLKASFDQVIDETLGYVISDINLALNRPYRTQLIDNLARQVDGIEQVEGWVMVNAQVLSNDKVTAVDTIVIAPPAGSQLIKPVMTAGRWVEPEDENAIVIGNHMIAKRPDLKVGDEIVIKVNGKESSWHIVGIFRLAGNATFPILYAKGEYLAKVLDQAGRGSSYRIVTSQHDPAYQAHVAKDLAKVLDDAGISVGQVMTGAEEVTRQASTTNILVYFLMVMALLIAVVGGLGLMGTMSMNVLERTREIGVLRSIGASNGAILRLVIVEGMLVGFISWVLGVLLAIPLGRGMSDIVGLAFINVPMPFVFSVQSLLIWLVIVLVLSALASILPALSAMRLTVREVLAYE